MDLRKINCMGNGRSYVRQNLMAYVPVIVSRAKELVSSR
jgi:hypothetical protein